MRRVVALMLVLVVIVGAQCSSQASRGAGQVTTKPLRVLFIGNSLTLGYSVPILTRELAVLARVSRPLEPTVVATGEYTLEKHWNDPRTLEAIRAGGWDVVVLQEFSSRPVLEPALFVEYARRLDAEVRRVGARTVLYLTWARSDLIAKGKSQSDWTAAHLELAERLGAAVSPAGVAWEYALMLEPASRLLQADGIHAEPLGAYVAACTFYATLYGKSPEGLSRPDNLPQLSDADVLLAQQVAWLAVTALEDSFRLPEAIETETAATYR